MFTYKFIGEDTLQEASSISEHNKQQSLPWKVGQTFQLNIIHLSIIQSQILSTANNIYKIKYRLLLNLHSNIFSARCHEGSTLVLSNFFKTKDHR